MSIGGGYGESKSKTQQQSTTDPWAPTQPLLKDTLARLQGLAGAPDDGSTVKAMDELTAFYKGGGEVSDLFKTVGGNLVNTPDRTGQVDSAYSGLTQRLTSTADRQNTDIANNPQLQALLTQVGDEAQNRTNAQFAAAGRDLSPDNNIAVGRGVTQAQLPLLLDQFNLEQGRSDAAARDLAQFGLEGARTQTGMDTSRAALQKTGAELTQAGREIEGADAGKVLDLALAKEKLPYDRVGWLTELLYPAAGLGSQSQGTSSTKGSQWGLSGKVSLADIGKMLAAGAG